MDYVPQANCKYSQVDFHLVLNQKSFQNQLRMENLLSAYQDLIANVLSSSYLFLSQVFLST